MDELDNEILKFIKDKLNDMNLNYREQDGIIWVEKEGKTYSIFPAFTECPF